MPLIHAVVLGLVQGFTEFLPISSSGHLLIVPWLFGWNDFDDESVKKTFDVALHLGTFIAVLGYFWRDVTTYVRDGLTMVVRREQPTTVEGRLAWLFVLATVPAVLVGALFEDTIDERLGTPGIIAVSLIVFGIVLAIADRLPQRKHVEDFDVRDALIVGTAQVLALNPGTSRSGITMTAARAVAYSRDAAVRISFLMSLPVIGGAVVFKLAGLVADGIPDGLLVPMIVGIVTSGISGWIAVWGTLAIVRTHSMMPFVIYRITLGVAILVIMATGLR